MARPTESGLSYFPLDVDFDYDDKFQMILAKYKAEGCWIILIVLCKIYDGGYFYKWTEKEQLLTSRRVNSDLTLVNSVIMSAVEYGIFDKSKFEQFSILTSNGIQKRYFEAVKKRKNIIIIQEYVVNGGLIPVNSVLISVNSDLTTQIKVNEIKVNESTEFNIEKDNRDSPTIWRSIFPNKTPGIVEINFVEGLREKFGSVKASQILFNLRESNFSSIRTMREALNEDGSIKPKPNWKNEKEGITIEKVD